MASSDSADADPEPGPGPEPAQGAEEVDYFRDSPLRMLGYANELGESTRYVLPRFVLPSYCVAFGYCVADTAHKSQVARADALRRGLDSNAARREALEAGADTLLWQTLASVLIPGFVINRVVRVASLGMSLAPAATPALPRRWAPVVTGLAAIPFIVEPIDTAVHHAMDGTVRKYLARSREE